jgi:hypothetical protein
MRCRIFGDTLAYHVVAKVQRPLFVGYIAAWEPPTCAYLPLQAFLARLSSDSRSRRGSEEMHPLRTLTYHRIAVGLLPHTMFAQRGSVFINLLLLRIAAD